jgi:branched-subunit amino acid ABC-type transport system permease component
MAVDFLYPIVSSTIFLAVFAISISLNFRISKFLNLSFGSIYALGAYLAYYTVKTSILFGIIVSALLAFSLGSILYLLIKRIGGGILDATIISLGFGIGLEEIIRILQGKGYYLVFSYSLWVAWIDFWELMQGLMLVLLLSALFVLYKSKVGIKLKFIEDDEFLAKIYGVNTERYSFLTVSLTSSVVSLLGYFSATSQALFPGIGWIPLVAGILIAAITSLFRSLGLSHYGRIVVLTFVYSSLLLLVGNWGRW